jgi:outer membrane protein assembly factor BamB
MRPLPFVLIPTLFTTELAHSNWPQFRGPQASGLNTNSVASINWNIDAGKNLQWKTAIPGLGLSSPIIWGDTMYVTTAVHPGKAELKVGLYGDIQSSTDILHERDWKRVCRPD